MFKAANPYDEIVAKATDEKQTEVNWDTLLSVWDKVADEGETGARNAVQAIQKRLQHRSANVQLFSLTLAGALVNNCGPPLHREISSKAFTQALVRLINDRTTHEDVKRQALKSIDEWVKENKSSTDFDLMADTYDSLKKQGLKFEGDRPKSPPRRADDALKREEEDLQRALAESAALADPRRGFTPSKALPNQPSTNNSYQPEPTPPRPTSAAAPKRVRALYNFVPQSPEELGFQVGDLITVTECVYEAWWKGELRGQVGIFPANHVEAVPDEVAVAGPVDEGEMEAELFAQAASVDKLLGMMRGMQGRGQNVADNDELIELYQKSMALRPKVVKLIERYEQKQAELEAMNQKFARAASTYEAIVGRQHQQQQQQPQQLAYQNGAYAHPQSQPGPSQYQGQGQPQQGQQQADPYAGWTEQQRREYDAQWAAYHQQMAEYEKAQAEYQRKQAALQQQQQQQQPAPGQGGAPQGAGEPVWDGQQYVHPQQQQAQPPPPTQAQHAGPSYQQGPPPGEQHVQPPPPAQATSPVQSHAAAAPTPVAGYYQQQAPLQHQEQAPTPAAASYPAQPYPDVAAQAPPPQQQPPQQGAYGGLNEQMSALSVNGGHYPPGPEGASIEYHHQQAPAQEHAYAGAPGQAPYGGQPGYAAPGAPVASPPLTAGGAPVQQPLYTGQSQQGGYAVPAPAVAVPHYPGAPQPWAGRQ